MDTNKINEIIENGFSTEAEVVHLLIEIRIYLEENNILKKYPIVKFYCDWILHCKKNNLKDLEDYFETLNILFNKNEVFNGKEISKYIDNLVSFTDFRNEMNKLLNILNIVTDFPIEINKWRKFEKKLCILLISKPIEFNNFISPSPFRKIKVFVISRAAPFMISINGALYWQIFMDTSKISLSGVIPGSIDLYND